MNNQTLTVGKQSTTIGVRYCLYARKSTEQEERQALSIDSQIKEMLSLAQKENLDVVEIKREAHSSKEAGQRPVFNKMIAEIKEGKFDGILAWHPDRLSRNAGDLGAIVDLMDQKKITEVRTYGQRFTNNPSEKFLLMILGSQAKLENDNKSVNVKRGLKTKCEMGLWPSVAPTGYLNSKNVNEKGIVYVDPDRAPVIRQMFEKVAYENWSGRKLYKWLREIRFVTRFGRPLSLANIYIILNSHFYYGTFEYPKGSNRWFQGRHIPVVTKDLYDQVQDKFRLLRKVREKNKEFAFTRIMSCGLCGSGITAEEKYKNLKDGTVKKYIYYGCTRAKDRDCKGGYVEERVLIGQLLELVDKIDLDRSGIRKQLEAEIERHNKFHSGLMGKPEEEYKAKEVDIRNYAKYILKEGMVGEKRELLANLRSRIIYKDKQLALTV